MNDICIYVQDSYAKKTYKVESYNVRKFFGIEMIKDVLIRGGFAVDYAGIATVHKYRIVLVSITSTIDWFSYIRERLTWKPGNYTVIIGGAGVLNIRPVLNSGDIFVFGRGEDIIMPLLESVLSGNEFDHSAVAYRETFSIDREYKLNQAGVYPHVYKIGTGAEYKESAIGCKRKCLFCGYTWQRKYTGNFGKSSGEYNRANVDERTIWDYDIGNPDSWFDGISSRYIVIGIDGLSERLRFMVNKPITNEMIHAFLLGCGYLSDKLYRVKLFNIIGLPGETDLDWKEFINTVTRADEMSQGTKRKDRLILELVSSHFKAMPVSPAAVWPVRYFDYQDYHKKIRVTPSRYQHKLFDGKTFRLLVMPSVESIATVTLVMLINRGIESDIEIIEQISRNKTFWNASARRKRVTLEKYLDIDRIFRGYTWEDLPTRYLASYVPNSGMAKLSRKLTM